MKIIYFIIIILLLSVAIAIGLGVGLMKDKSSSGGGPSPSPSPVIEQWVAVGFDLGGGLDNIMYSPDGQSWTQTTTGASFSSKGFDVAYGTSSNGDPLWVAVGNDSVGLGNIMYSPDGKTWTRTTTGASFSVAGYGVTQGTSNGTSPLWVAAGDDGGGLGNIMYSPDSQSWTESSPAGTSFSSQGSGVAYGTSSNGDPLWVAVGYDVVRLGNIMYSPDGKTWTESSPTGTSFFTSGNGVAYGTSNGTSPLWVAVGTDVPGGLGNIMYSPDGKTWTDSGPTGDSFSVAGYGVAYGTSSNGDPLWVAVGNDSVGLGNIMYSNDGKTWSQPTAGASFYTQGLKVAYGTDSTGDPLWVAVGNDSVGLGNIMYSNDGKTWTESGPAGASFSQSGLGVASGTSNPAFASHPGLLPWPST